MRKRLAIFGCGGHAKSVADVALHTGFWRDIVFIDKNALPEELILGFPVLPDFDVQYCDVFVAIGDNLKREMVSTKYLNNLTSIISPLAYIGHSANIGKGVFFAHGAHIGPLSTINDFCVVNTNASIDHECVLGKAVTVAPNATLCGNVNVGDYTWIGASAVIRENVSIASNAVIGCGAAVIKDCDSDGIYVGVPATLCENNKVK